jgi:hypothetical protein
MKRKIVAVPKTLIHPITVSPIRVNGRVKNIPDPYFSSSSEPH